MGLEIQVGGAVEVVSVADVQEDETPVTEMVVAEEAAPDNVTDAGGEQPAAAPSASAPPLNKNTVEVKSLAVTEREKQIVADLPEAERRTLQKEVAAKLWLEEVLDTKLPNNFVKALTDGVKLCRLMRAICAELVPELHDSFDGASGRRGEFFKMKENIFFFLEAHAELLLGYDGFETFCVGDLFANDVNKVQVVAAITSLGRYSKEKAEAISFAGPYLRDPEDVTDDALLANVNFETHMRMLSSPRSPRAHHLHGATSRSVAVMSKRRKKSLALSVDSQGFSHHYDSPTPSRARLGGLSRVDTDPSMIHEFRLASPTTLSALMDPVDDCDGRMDEDRTLMRQSSYSALTSPRSPATAGDILLTEYKQHMEPIVLLQAFARYRSSQRIFKRLVYLDTQRENVATEILATERTYVSNLCLLQVVFLEPLTTQKLVNIPMGGPMLAEVSVIVSYGKLLLGKLENRVRDWSVHSRLGEVFLRITDFMKVYTQYVKDYNTITEQIAAARASETFAEFLAKCESNVGNKPLSSFLILPVQRLPRYQMLLEALLKRTNTEHPDYNDLHAALGKMISVASYVNERKKEFERINKVLLLQQRFVGKVEPHRRYISEGDAWLVPSEKPVVLFLCNDILIVGRKVVVKKKEKYKVLHTLQLVQVSVVDAPDTPEVKHALHFEQGRNKLLRIRLADQEQKLKWKTTIRSLQGQLQSSEASIGQKSHQRGVSVGSTTDAMLLEMLKAQGGQRKAAKSRYISVGDSNDSVSEPEDVPTILVGEQGEDKDASEAIPARVPSRSQRFIDIKPQTGSVVRSKSEQSSLSDMADTIPARQEESQKKSPRGGRRESSYLPSLLDSLDEVRAKTKGKLGGSAGGKHKRDSWRLSFNRKKKKSSDSGTM